MYFNDTTTYSAAHFFDERTRFEKERIANDLLGGFGFDVEEWAMFLGGTVVDAAWLAELRRVAELWERGH